MTLKNDLTNARLKVGDGTMAAALLDAMLKNYCPDAGGGPNLDPDADEEEEKKKGIKK